MTKQTGTSRPPAISGGRPLLTIDGLQAFHGRTKILKGVSLALPAGSCLAVVGESGSGKTTLARCIGGLHGSMNGRLTFDGKPIAAFSGDRPATVRRQIQYIFQNPYASLNPRRTIGQSIAATLSILDPMPREETRARIDEVLARVALPPETAKRYPQQLSGGQRQRAALARALAVKPRLLICDEVTSALDVSIQAVIIELIAGLMRDQGLSLIFVTHNLALVANIADRVAVLTGGRIVEDGETAQVLQRPVSAEARRLLEDTPRLCR